MKGCTVAQKVQVILVDDLDGGEAVETIKFGLDGKNFEIDLSEDNAKALRDAFAPYVGVARGLGRAPAAWVVVRPASPAVVAVPLAPTASRPSRSASGCAHMDTRSPTAVGSPRTSGTSTRTKPVDRL